MWYLALQPAWLMKSSGCNEDAAFELHSGSELAHVNGPALKIKGTQMAQPLRGDAIALFARQTNRMSAEMTGRCTAAA